MKWERCIRCGSNRVVESRNWISGVIVIFFAMMVGALPTSMKSSFLIQTFVSVIAMVLVIFGVRLIINSKKLVCKDCEISWKPTKD